MAIVEGIGDEVLYIFGFVLATALFFAAWLSTRVRPLWNAESMWLVQLRTSPTQAVVEVGGEIWA